MNNRTMPILSERAPVAVLSGRTRSSTRRHRTGNEVRARPAVGSPRMTTGNVRLDTLVVSEIGTVRRPTVTLRIDGSVRLIVGCDVN